MVKFATKRSGSQFVSGRGEWKRMIVNKLIYVAEALVWRGEGGRKLEILKEDFGSWFNI